MSTAEKSIGKALLRYLDYLSAIFLRIAHPACFPLCVSSFGLAASIPKELMCDLAFLLLEPV
jgi:hypothetical protein